MSYIYNLSILIPIHTKNTGCLCKQATGQIDQVKIAFPGCTFVSSHLFRAGKFPGKKASCQTGFFWCACLWLCLPRDCKEECLGGNPEFSDRPISDCPFGASLCTTLLLLLSHFSYVRCCVTPQTAAHQASPSLGFSRQEYWSGLPVPSPMHACMLSRFSRVWLCATI